MRILITGGAGFIGSAVVRTAIRQGHEVMNIDALTYASCLENLREVQDHKNYSFEKIDIRNKDDIRNILFDYKPHYLMNLAAESHVDRSIDSADDVLTTNIIGTYILLDTFTKYWGEHKKNTSYKFHHVSTDEVFGNIENDCRFTEETKYNPKNPYSASKASSDHLVRSWINTYGIPAIITNCSNNYGPYQFPEKLIPVVILNALNNKDIPIYGSGENIRDWIHVDDHADALLLLLEQGKSGETYNIGSNCEMSNINLVHLICEILDKKLKPKKSFKSNIKFVADRPGHDIHYGINPSKLLNNYPWRPKLNIEQGIEQTVSWYLNNQEWLDNLSDRDGVGTRLGTI
jgi:dTDP-glucose 4,6-dehydratase